MGIYTTDGVEAYFKDAIVARLTDLLGENLSSIFDLPKVYDELAMALKARVADDFAKYGIDLVGPLPGRHHAARGGAEADRRARRHGRGRRHERLLKFKAARAMGDAAQSGGGEAGGAAAPAWASGSAPGSA